MRYAIISDVHANAAALRAVLVDAQDLNAEKVICLGDVLGYGPDPVPALEEIYSRVHVCLAGNHDDAVCGRRTTEDFNDFAAAAVARQRKSLTAEAMNWLRQLPYTYATSDFACAHGDFSDPESFCYIQDPEDALPSFEERAEQLLFVGHTHKPGVIVLKGDEELLAYEPMDFRLEEGQRYVVNVGSVGYPRSGFCRSYYCIYDDEARTVYFRSLPFDLEGYREKMGGKGLDEAPWMAARAAQRAIPRVRDAASFGKPTLPKTPPKPKVLVVERPSKDTTPAVSAPEPKRRSRWPLALLLLLVVTAGVAGWLSFDEGARTVALAQVEACRQALEQRRPQANPQPAKAVSPVMPPQAGAPAVTPAESASQGALSTPPVAGWSAVLTNRVLRLEPGQKIHFAVKLAPKSNPVKAHLVFRDKDGQIMPGAEVAYPPFASSLSHGTGKSAVPAPEGACEVLLEAAKASGQGFCEITRFELDVKELERGKRK